MSQTYQRYSMLNPGLDCIAEHTLAEHTLAKHTRACAPPPLRPLTMKINPLPISSFVNTRRSQWLQEEPLQDQRPQESNLKATMMAAAAATATTAVVVGTATYYPSPHAFEFR